MLTGCISSRTIAQRRADQFRTSLLQILSLRNLSGPGRGSQPTVPVAVENKKTTSPKVETLQKPVEPGPEDCCQTGCAECVWDVYARDLREYNLELARVKGEPPPVDPFEELERRLFGQGD